ncbi:MAG: DNA-3-methyladenine glycosylase [Pelagibacteraceae bacterium]|nr:DNA-3-methyladenine glycosylase [Pelagibacteraceae bacterium]|tara:strand:- start:11211 stop:11837 length:627 start_codon:yes stop_codon:yes gene_type:complete
MLYKKPPYWNKAIKHLKHKDKILAKIINAHKGGYLIIKKGYFISLIRAIIGQQISVKAAQSIWIKFNKKYKTITPEIIVKENIKNLKKIGLSKQKATYIKNIGNYFIKNKKRIKRWSKLKDNEIIDDLTSIKGVGIWTAEMFLIFSLGRSNVLPLKDLGLLKSISINYNKKMPPKEYFLKKLKNDWDPWCSVATWFLWRSIDPVPVNY